MAKGKKKKTPQISLPGSGMLQKAARSINKRKVEPKKSTPKKSTKTGYGNTTTAKNPPGIKRKTKAQGEAELKALREKRKAKKKKK